MLHGRLRERTVLDDLLAAARSGRSGALVLRGEAGIGKSALLAYAAGAAADLRVLRCAGIESESEFPFAAVHQVLRPLTGLIDAIPARQAEALRAAFGAAPAAGGDRFLVSLAVLSVLAEAAEERPVLCLIDDAHWLDGASADALTFVARRLDADGVALVFAARDGFAAPGLPELTVTGLDRAEAGALLAERSAVELPDAVRDSVVASTAGNPLALLELPAALTKAQLSGHSPLPDRLPVSAEVEQVFLDRVRRQDAPTQTLLLVAAAEETGDLALVLRAAATLGAAAGALDAAESAGLLRVDAHRVAFRHPLVRTAVYRGATFWQRRQAQEALADALTGEDDRDRRAWHRAAAALGPDESVAAELCHSADRARQRGGHAAAASAYERSAALTASAELRAARLADAADAAWLAGTPDRARTLLDRAGPLARDPLLRARLEHLRGSIEAACGTPSTAFAVLVAGAEPVAALAPDLAARMLTEAGQAAWLGGDAPGLHEVGRRLAALDGAVPLSAELVRGLDNLLSGDPAEAARHLRAVASAGSGAGGPAAPPGPPAADGQAGPPAATATPAAAGPPADPRAAMLIATGATFLGDDAVAIALFTAAVTRARSAGAMTALPWLLAPLSSLGAWTSRYAAATGDVTEGLRIAEETGQENPAAHLRAVLAWLAAVHGHEDDCRTHATAALARALGQRLGPAAGIASWALALLDLGAGRPAEARDRLAALAVAGPGESHPMVGIFSAADLVEAAVRTDEPATARQALGRLETWAAHSGSAWGSALVARCRGLLDADDRHFADALATHARGGRPFDTARTELLFGEHLRRRRRRADARRHLRAAHETFERLGLPTWADQAGAELRATGETARRREPGTPTRLTPQEVQIVRMVSTGATNREVAAQLFLSPRTVDYHLRKVFTKLDLTSRAELILRAGDFTDATVSASPVRQPG
ncbi:helix-turn-helix transcriptional regulator [Virgisporangium aurantiacum]|uniref:LuxR family transcriptional regulator n=1 Tax=Virgisporangium aurantiacum TaxID=175570 RepID=A0A8J3ZGK1_9ACTN|nr:LuxR family transcriptional regulator [Virgisporangium aurantiacum]GIJ60968.1 LuxR family transcriptional regulator [Virgisporangium aurantiacum]